MVLLTQMFTQQQTQLLLLVVLMEPIGLIQIPHQSLLSLVTGGRFLLKTQTCGSSSELQKVGSKLMAHTVHMEH